MLESRLDAYVDKVGGEAVPQIDERVALLEEGLDSDRRLLPIKERYW